jgi:hypothetical protein
MHMITSLFSSGVRFRAFTHSHLTHLHSNARCTALPFHEIRMVTMVFDMHVGEHGFRIALCFTSRAPDSVVPFSYAFSFYCRTFTLFRLIVFTCLLYFAVYFMLVWRCIVVSTLSPKIKGCGPENRKTGRRSRTACSRDIGYNTTHRSWKGNTSEGLQHGQCNQRAWNVGQVGAEWPERACGHNIDMTSSQGGVSDTSSR